MEVPAWILVILTVFSTLLIVIGCFFLVVLIKYRIKQRKYDQVSGYDSSKKKKYVPGKTAAYFNGSFSDTVPLTYPTTLQAGTPVLFPPFKKKHSYSSVGNHSFSPKTRTVKYPGTPSSHTLNRCASFDDQLFRKSFSLKSSDFKVKDSPLARDDDSRVSSRNSMGGGSELTETLRAGYTSIDSPRDGYGSPPDPVRIPINNETYYSHSEFFSDDDNSSLHPSSCPETENVVSYDQETDYKNLSKQPSTNGPAFLSFQLQYNSKVPELMVTVKNAFDLQPKVDVTSDSVNSYVNLCLVPEDFLWKRTRVVENDTDPEFNETFRIRDVLYHKLREYTLCLFVMDTHPLLGERPIGKVLYPLSELRAEQAVDICQELTSP